MNHATRVYDSILELASNADNPTPLVRLTHVVGLKHAEVWAKLEWYNPFGAVKDRVAASLIKDSEERGLLKAGMRIVEPTSGNTGMALAMLANAKGYKFTATLSNKIPSEKRASLRLFGTDLRELDDDLCPAPGAPEGAIALAAKLGDEPGNFHPNQYKNPANPAAHYQTTGPEIWKQTGGKVTHFVAGLGTCGTVTGTGRFLKEQNKQIRVIGVHPVEGHDIPGVRSIKQLAQTALFAPNEYDGLVEVNNAEAYQLCKRLNQEESIIAGPSSAMALAGALKKIPDEPGTVCVVIFPDNAFKYASSMKKHLPELFAGSKETSGDPNLVNLVEFAKESPDNISLAEAQARVAKGAAFLDVRTLEEFTKVRAQGTKNIPLPGIVGGYAALPDDKAAPVVAICKSGMRSMYAMLLMKAMGYQDVKNVKGGTDAWVAAGLPTISGS